MKFKNKNRTRERKRPVGRAIEVPQRDEPLNREAW